MDGAGSTEEAAGNRGKPLRSEGSLGAERGCCGEQAIRNGTASVFVAKSGSQCVFLGAQVLERGGFIPPVAQELLHTIKRCVEGCLGALLCSSLSLGSSEKTGVFL